LSAIALALAGAGQAAAQAANQITEVVVTAERRTQSVQKSSLAISVISPDDISRAGVTQVRDLTKLEPGVQIGQGGPATQIYIRGVGDFGSTPITNPAVATNIDGVYISRSNSIEGNFFDLERIEVLKGPQGTLYGRNASGGAINIITAKPKLGVFSSHLETEVGNYNLIRVEGSTNIPVSDTFALRAALQVVSRDGYASQDFDDDHHESFRLSALWKPSDRLSVRVTADHTHVGGTGPAYVFKGPFSPEVAAVAAANGVVVPTDPRLSFTDPRTHGVYNATVANFCVPANAPAASATKSGTIASAPQGFCPAGQVNLFQPPNADDAHLKDRFNNISMEVNYDLGFATLTVIPAYRRVRNDYTVYPLSVYTNAQGAPEISDTYSIEARLGATTENLTWVAGLYGYREGQNVKTATNTFLYFGDNVAENKLRTNSAAVFGQATYSVADNLRLILGGRYSHDRRITAGLNKTFDSTLSFNYVIGQICYQKASPCITDVWKGDKKFNSFTYKVGAEYDLTPQNMLFVTWATGEKAGGFNAFSQLGVGDVAGSYDPEKLGALEIGSRNRFLDSRLQVNVEGFYWKYKDAQQTYATVNNAGAVVNGYVNAGQATMYGFDVDGIAKLTPVDTVQVGVEYLHSNFDRFIYQTSGLTPPANTCPLIDSPGAAGFQTVDCSGRDLIRAPEWSGTASYTHSFVFGNGATVDASGSVQFSSSRELGVTYTPGEHAKGYHVFDAQVVYRPESRKWSIAGYVRNINNALVYTGAYNQPAVLPSLIAANLAPPRTYGVRIAADF
jgi:iron complex outermembrane receptor protein